MMLLRTSAALIVSFGGVSYQRKTLMVVLSEEARRTVRDTGSGATASQNYAQDLRKQDTKVKLCH